MLTPIVGVDARRALALCLTAMLLWTLGCGSQESISERRRQAQRQLPTRGASESEPVGETSAPVVDQREDGAASDGRDELDALGLDDDADLDEPDDFADAGDRGRVREGGRESQALEHFRRQLSLREKEARYHKKAGDGFYQQGRFEDAVASYRRALDLDPGFEAARERLLDTQEILGDRPAAVSNAPNLIEEERIRREQRTIEINRALRDGEEAFNRGEVDEAERLVQRAVDAIRTDPDYDPDQRARAQNLLEQIRSQMEEVAAVVRDQQLQEAQRQQQHELEAEERRKHERVQVLLRKALDLRRKRRYQQAVVVCEQILTIEPANRIARFWLNSSNEELIKERRLRLIHDRDINRKLLNENMREGSIPYNDVFVFPDADDWERTRSRSSTLQFGTETVDSEPVRRIKSILESRQMDLPYDEATPLSDIIADFRNLLGINIAIDPEINTDENPISINVQNVSAKNALNHVLEKAGLGYSFRDNLLYITAPEKATGDLKFEIYDVSDILNSIRDFAGPELQLRSPGDTTSGEQSIVFTDDPGEAGDQTIDSDQLMELIEGSTGGEDAWGDQNSMEEHNGSLLVTASADMHAGIERVLANLRKDSDLFVVIEARFIDINDDFLEDVGIDSRALGVVNNFGTPFGNVINDTRTGGQDLGFSKTGSPTRDVTLIMGQDRWAGRIAHVIDGFTGSFRRNGNLNAGGGIGGLTLQQTWLEPFQINTILRAVQERADVRQLTAPVVTAANNQRVYVSVITQRAYIADYELVSGGTGFAIIEVADPVVQTFQEGVILDVEPVISHDKKYVTLDVRPTLATLIGGIISTINISLGSFTNVAFQVPIGIPEISLQQSFTSVTVPNRGTVLLGGFKSLDEGQWKSYLPILGDIPLFGNLFRRKSTVSEKRSLVILLSATIVDLRVSEKQKFNEAD